MSCGEGTLRTSRYRRRELRFGSMLGFLPASDLERSVHWGHVGVPRPDPELDIGPLSLFEG